MSKLLRIQRLEKDIARSNEEVMDITVADMVLFSHYRKTGRVIKPDTQFTPAKIKYLEKIHLEYDAKKQHEMSV